MSTYTYYPDVHYPYPIRTDVPAEESLESYSSSLSPQTPAGAATTGTVSSTHLWEPSEWRCSSMSVFNVDSTLSSWQQVQASSYQVPNTYVRNDYLAPYTEGTGSTAFAPPEYSEATSSGGASMPVAPTPYGVYPSVGTPMYYQGEAEADERPPRCDVFDEPLRREDYVQTEHCGGEYAPTCHTSLYEPQQPMYVAGAPYPDQAVYGTYEYGSSLPSSRKPYHVHPHVDHEQGWAATQVSSTFVSSPQQQEQALQPEPGFEQRQEDSYLQTMMDPYPQIPGKNWPQHHPCHPSPAPVAVSVSSSSSLANAITPPVKKPHIPRPESTSVPATARPSPSPPTPVPIVSPQSHLAPNIGSSPKDTAFKAAPPHSPSIVPPRLPRNPRREPTSFRPFHPYPAHQHSFASAAASSSNPAASNDLCSATATSPNSHVVGLFGSYSLGLPDGSNTPLPGPTCAPETSSSIMRLVLTPALSKHHQGGVLGALGGARGLDGWGGWVDAGSTLVPPVVRRPRMACLFCKKRKIACGPGPGAGEEGGASLSQDSPEGSSSPVSERGTTANTGVSARATAGGKVSHHDDGGPCNQCARRGLRCERPTESRRGTRKAKKSTSEGDGMVVHNGVALLELVPRKKGGKKGRMDVDKTMTGGGGDARGGYDEDTPGDQQ